MGIYTQKHTQRTRKKRHNNLKLQCKKEHSPNTNVQQVTLIIASLQGDVGLPGDPGDPGLKGEKVSVSIFASVFEWTSSSVRANECVALTLRGMFVLLDRGYCL